MVAVKSKLALLRSEHPPWLTLLHRVMGRKKPGNKNDAGLDKLRFGVVGDTRVLETQKQQGVGDTHATV